MSEGKGKSPYQRHGKAPYKYSEQYQKWRDAIKRGDQSQARYWAREHYQRFVRGIVLNEPERKAA